VLEAKEKLDIMKLSPAQKADYDIHIKELRREASLYESSYVSGKIDGKEIPEKEVAVNLIELGLLTDEQIAKSTGLTVKQVEVSRQTPGQ
jgi:isopentenyl diphosphate isomerase/L-lactate dehydrogenase-like FMN-dependent dehydrogenase